MENNSAWVFLILCLFAISTSSNAQQKVTVDELMNNVGNVVTVCDKVVDGRFLPTSAEKLTLLNTGGRFPNQKLTIVIPNESRDAFPSPPEIFFPNKSVCITGKVEIFREKPQIRLTSVSNISDAAGNAFVQSNTNSPVASNANSTILPPATNSQASAVPQQTTPRRIGEPNVLQGEVLRLPPGDPGFEERTIFYETFYVGFSGGMMHGLADVGRKKSSIFPANVDWKSTRANASIFTGINFSDKYTARLELTYGKIEGNDKNGRYGRSMNYRSHIFEIAALGEFTPIYFKTFSPYAVIGVGLFTFKPQVQYNGTWIDAQPLHLEGQSFSEFPERKDYKTTQVSFPLGVGLKTPISQRTTLKFEWLYRFTTTDYLDDASTFGIDPALFSKYLPPSQATIASAITNQNARNIQRGGPAKDHFLTMNAKLAFRLGK